MAGKRAPGRPRSEQSRESILASTLKLLEDSGFQTLSIESVANDAGASKATVYRWWPNKASLVADAFAASSLAELRFPDTGSVIKDLSLQMSHLVNVFKGRHGKLVASLIGGGQSDPELIESFVRKFLRPRRQEAYLTLERAVERGELPRNLDFDVVLDSLYGPIYMRFLLGHGPLNRAFTDEVCILILRPLVLKAK